MKKDKERKFCPRCRLNNRPSGNGACLECGTMLIAPSVSEGKETVRHKYNPLPGSRMCADCPYREDNLIHTVEPQPKAPVSEGKKEYGDAEQIVERINSKINMDGASPIDWVWEALAVLESDNKLVPDVAQPQPAGTERMTWEAIIKWAYENTPDAVVAIGQLATEVVEARNANAALAALQQSHDACVKVLEDIQANFFRRLAKNFPKLNTAIRAALAKAEKLRAAKNGL